jgi:uncharacterized protein (TIGR03435 family)
MNTRKSPHQVLMRGTDVPMAELAGNLGNQLGRFVTDQTGLGEQYDLVLDWDPDQTADTPGGYYGAFALYRASGTTGTSSRTGESTGAGTGDRQRHQAF